MNVGKPLPSMVVWAGLIILLSATNQAQVIYSGGGGGGLGGSSEMPSTPTIPYPGAGHREKGCSTSIKDYDHDANPIFHCDVMLMKDWIHDTYFHQKEREAGDVDNQIRKLKQTLRKNRQQIAQLGERRNAYFEKALHPKQLTHLNEERLAATRQAAQANLEFLSQYTNFLRHFSAADELIFYPGLPREDYPPDPFPKNAEEAKAPGLTDAQGAGISKDWSDYDYNSLLDWVEEKNTFTLNHPNDYWFYRSAMLVDTTAVEKIRSTMVDYRSFKPYITGWMGGIFTPDFCIEWKARPLVKSGVTDRNPHARFHLLVDIDRMQAQFLSPNSSFKFSFSEEVRDEFLRLTKKADHGQAEKRTDNGPN